MAALSRLVCESPRAPKALLALHAGLLPPYRPYSGGFGRRGGETLSRQSCPSSLFGSDKNLKLIDPTLLPPITINGHTIDIVKSVKNLGVVLNDNLNWNTQVARISSRVHGALKRLRFRANFLSVNLNKQLVTALIFPHLDYCSLVYCDISDYLNTKLQRLQYHLVRFIFRLRRDAALKPYYKRLNWLQIGEKRKYFMAVTTYKILTDCKPGYLVPFFPKVTTDIRRSARSHTVAASSSFDLPQIIPLRMKTHLVIWP